LNVVLKTEDSKQNANVLLEGLVAMDSGAACGDDRPDRVRDDRDSRFDLAPFSHN
jgi:hypothetical protein